jgi:hypothetical protein
MKKLLLGLAILVSLCLASDSFATGTATVKIDSITIGSQALEKAPVMTDNAGSKMDSGALTLVAGSQTVTTSLTAVDRVFTSLSVTGGTTTVASRVVISGAGFTIYIYDPITGGTATTSHAGHWFAIDE